MPPGLRLRFPEPRPAEEAAVFPVLTVSSSVPVPDFPHRECEKPPVEAGDREGPGPALGQEGWAQGLSSVFLCLPASDLCQGWGRWGEGQAQGGQGELKPERDFFFFYCKECKKMQ